MVAVNAIIRKPTKKKWRTNIDSNDYFLVSKQLNTKFAPNYRIANSGMTVNMKSNGKYFVKPSKHTQEGQALMLIFDRDSIEVNNNPQKEPTKMTIMEKMIDRRLI